MYDLIKHRIIDIIDIKSDSNKEATIKQINEEIYLRGSNIVYLICSALLASVGLDVGSPAVIIGAMLISPLMSPILGIGLSLGVHDKENFFVSVREFSLSVFLSLLVSSLYFILTPMGNVTSEILSRIKPTALDIIVAFFGGLAGIVAVTRSKIASALPGVAIATALMPPVCTAGFGLATARFEYFFGAIYLFFINAVFISFSAYLIVRYLKFPFKEYPNKTRLIRTRLIIVAFVVIAAIPSFFIFYNVIRDAKLNKNLDNFIKDKVQSQEVKVIEWKFIPSNKDSNQLNIFTAGPRLSRSRKDSLNFILTEYGIYNTKIIYTQLSDDKGLEFIKSELKTDFTEKLRLSQKSDSEQEKEAIEKLKVLDSLKISEISNDIKLFYPEIKEIGLSEFYYESSIINDSSTINKIPICTIKWNTNISYNRIKEKQKTIYTFLKNKISSDTIRIINLK